MKTMIKVAMIAIAFQAAAASAEQARPVAVDIRVEAADNELSLKAAGISEAVLKGDNASADRLLGDLYSGGAVKKEAAPVQAPASRCCPHSQHGGAAPETQSPQASQPAQPAPAATPSLSASDDAYVDAFIAAIKAQQKTDKEKEEAEKEKKKAEEAKEKAAKARTVLAGFATMAVSLLLLLVLL